MIKKILHKIILATAVLGFLIPSIAFSARTDSLWDYPNGTSYIKPNGDASGNDILIFGSNHYFNFGSVSGSNGYGFRDNSGVMEFKNSGGVWTAIGSGSGGGGSGGGTFSTTTSTVAGQLINYSNNNTDIVTIGGTSTSTAKFYFDPNTTTFRWTGNATSTGVFNAGINVTAPYFNATSTTATSTFKKAISVSVPSGISESFETFRDGEAYPRSYLEGFGSLFMGGLGTKPPPLKLSKDPFNQQFLNFTNTEGPASIMITDSTSNCTVGTNAESTHTNRVITGGGGSEFFDVFNNHYCTNGDLDYGFLFQKISPGQYRNVLTLFTDNAASDPSGQIKNANWFSIISPTIPSGSSGGTTISGTGSVSTANATLTGIGTSFGNEIQVGDSLAIGSMYATVLSIESPTSLTMAATSTITTSGASINKFNRTLGEMGIRLRNPSAFIHIAGGIGGATASSSSFKIDSAIALLTTPEAGAIENFGGNMYYSPGAGVRKSFVMNNYGVSGGQTIIGGNGPSENLLLQSTSDATRGQLIFGGTDLSVYDESTSRWGLGTTTPGSILSVGGVGNFASTGSTFYSTLTAPIFTGTSTSASTFPYASTTALSATTICLTGDTCRTSWPSGGGSGGGTFSTTTSQNPTYNVNYPTATTDVVAIGSSSTTTASYWFDPNKNNAYLKGLVSIGTTTRTDVNGNVGLTVQGARGTTIIGATDGIAKFGFYVDNLATIPVQMGSITNHPFGFFTNNGAILLTIATSSNIGISTTSPYKRLSVNGPSVITDNVLSSFFTATSTNQASTLPYASTTAINIGTLNGPLQANNGFVSATTSIGVSYGGTGLTTLTGSRVLLTNATDQIVTSSNVSWNNTSQTISILNASTTNLSASSFASTTSLIISGIPNCSSTNALTTNGSGLVACGTISGSGGASSNWNQQINFGVLTLTPTTTIPVWVKDQFFASSSATIAGNVRASNFTATGTVSSTFPYASTTALSATTACLGTDCRTAWPVGYTGPYPAWATTTSSVGGQAINFPRSNTDIVTIGSNSTSTAFTVINPNLGIVQVIGPGGANIRPQFNGFGSAYAMQQWQSSLNDIQQTQMINRDPGASSAGCHFFVNDKSTLDTVGAASNYYGGTCFAGSNYNIPGFNGIRPNGIGLFATDGPVTIGSGSANAASSSIYFQAGSGLDASYDMTLAGGTGNLGIGIAAPTERLHVFGNGIIANLLTASRFTATSSIASIFPYASSTAITASGAIYGGNFLATGSSTLQNFTGVNATTTNATSTQLFSTIGNITTFAVTNATHFGSTTLQNFTGINATTTNATSTTLSASSSLCLAGDCRAVWPSSSAVGGSDKQVQFNDGGSALGGSAGFTYDKTLTKGTLTYASTTAMSTSYASSTLYFGASLASCNGASNALTWNAGIFGCNSISGGGTFPFTSTTNFNQAANSTSTALWLTAFPYSLMASSSAIIDGDLRLGSGSFTFASSTASTTISHLDAGNIVFPADMGKINGLDFTQTSAAANSEQSYSLNANGSSTPNLTIFSRSNGSAGVFDQKVGIGTSTPWGDFSVVSMKDATTTIIHGDATHPSCDQYYSPNGTAYRTYMSNAGALITEAGNCQSLK